MLLFLFLISNASIGLSHVLEGILPEHCVPIIYGNGFEKDYQMVPHIQAYGHLEIHDFASYCLITNMKFYLKFWSRYNTNFRMITQLHWSFIIVPKNQELSNITEIIIGMALLIQETNEGNSF